MPIVYDNNAFYVALYMRSCFLCLSLFSARIPYVEHNNIYIYMHV